MSSYLVDTNVLLRFIDPSQPLNPIARGAVRKLRADGHVLRMGAQNSIEFWNAATRPAARNGFGLTPAEAHRRLRVVERVFLRLPDTDDVYVRWRQLVVAVGVSGVQVHDARLVALMLTHGVTHILTFNTADFIRFVGPAGITVVDPAVV